MPKAVPGQTIIIITAERNISASNLSIAVSPVTTGINMAGMLSMEAIHAGMIIRSARKP